jgi:hypothetical protein
MKPLAPAIFYVISLGPCIFIIVAFVLPGEPGPVSEDTDSLFYSWLPRDVDDRLLILIYVFVPTILFFVYIGLPYRWVDLILVSTIWGTLTLGYFALQFESLFGRNNGHAVGLGGLEVGNHLSFALVTVMAAPILVGSLIKLARKRRR